MATGIKEKGYVKMKCEECGRVNYWTNKSRKLKEEKLELKKFCDWCRAHTVHIETKK